ncbi:unnamed protein product [Fusarium graminearum]|nr:unnamed protein product [Fusarium graminearum]
MILLQSAGNLKRSPQDQVKINNLILQNIESGTTGSSAINCFWWVGGRCSSTKESLLDGRDVVDLHTKHYTARLGSKMVSFSQLWRIRKRLLLTASDRSPRPSE